MELLLFLPRCHRLPSPRDCRRHRGFRRLCLDSIYNLDSPTVMASDRSPRGSEYLATFRKHDVRGMFPDLDYYAYDCRVKHEYDDHVEGKGDTGRDVDEVGEGKEKVTRFFSEGVTPIENGNPHQHRQEMAYVDAGSHST